MISYHLLKNGGDKDYGHSFKTEEVYEAKGVAKYINEFVWSPCIWRDGKRDSKQFLKAYWLALDFDDPEMTLNEAIKAFCDMVHVIGTTRNHQKEKKGIVCDRFRVVLKFTTPIEDLRNYCYTMHKAMERYPVDKQPKDGARFFYPCREIVSVSNEGYTEDPLVAPDTFGRPVSKEKIEAYKATGTTPPFARWALSNVVPMGRRNTTWYRVAKDLARLGMPMDNIVARILASPTYESQKVDSALMAEIAQCARSGVKAATKEY